MICYKCKTQMQQFCDIGDGYLSEDGQTYQTWEIKVCPECGLLVKEYYEAIVVNEVYVSHLKEASDKKTKPRKSEAK